MRGDYRAFAVLGFVLVLLLLLRKGGDLFIRGEDLDVALGQLPPTVFPGVLVPRGRKRETTDLMCDCNAKPLIPTQQTFTASQETGPIITPVYAFLSPRVQWLEKGAGA